MNDHWEMRLKNLLWTVSGDYSLEMSFEDDKWEETPWAALYDAVKEGAYVRYCSQTFREEVSLYLLKKIYLGGGGGHTGAGRRAVYRQHGRQPDSGGAAGRGDDPTPRI